MSDNAFELIKGDDMSIQVSITDDNGAAVNLEGYKVFFTAKQNLNDPDSAAVLSKEVETGDDEGTVDINFTAAETDSLKPRSYWWDIQLEKDGVISSTKRQLFRVVADVTRRINDGTS
jgi:hypothetical protein